MQRPSIRNELNRIGRAVVEKESPKSDTYVLSNKRVIQLIENLIEKIKLS